MTFVVIRGPIHIVTTADMERATGLATPPADAPVQEELADAFRPRRETLVALCGFVVSDRGVPRGEAATIRALRADPARFEGERVCDECLRRETTGLAEQAAARA